jgi:DNA mismatch repair ATPase MutS
MRLLRNALPMNTSWVSLKPETEFMPFDNTVQELNKFFESESGDAQIPDAIAEMVAQNQILTIEALGGMIFYLRSLNMATDLLSQKSFNIYDPIRKGEGMVLDGQTLSHLEVREKVMLSHRDVLMVPSCRSCSTTREATRGLYCSCCNDVLRLSESVYSGYG